MDIAILSGDGIGPEVMKEAIKVLDTIQEKFSITMNITSGFVGGEAIDKFGTALPSDTLEICENADAILLGSVGGEKWNDVELEERPEKALLTLRKHFNLFTNLRPIKLYPYLISQSPLRLEIVENGFDFIVVRELTGGIYFGNKKIENEKAIDEMTYTKKEIERICEFAFRIANKRNKKVTSVDKANVLSCSSLWRSTINKLSKNYPDIELNHLYIDNACMQFVKRPEDFDVVVTSNMFGDILSDLGSALTGSLGLLPSASIGETKFGLYEPAGGTAPDIAGKGIANPIAQVLSVAMMMEYSFELDSISQKIYSSIFKILKDGWRTPDLLSPNSEENNNERILNTKSMGDMIQANLQGSN